MSVFHRDTCNFGFATHLFGNEIKALVQSSAQGNAAPRGVSFRIAPTSHPELLNGDEPVSTLTQDFHTRLDNLLRTLVHAKPHFVRCIRPNINDSLTEFDRTLVVQQIRSLQILETVNLMSGGFPHRMRFKAFNTRYKMLAPSKSLFRSEDKSVDDCETILDCYSRDLKNLPPVTLPRNTEWAHGRKHIFLSEGARQQLERIRDLKRTNSALTIQRVWRGHNVRRKTRFNSKLKPQVIQSHHNPGLPHTQSTPLSSKVAAAGFNPIGSGLNQTGSARMSTRSLRPRPQPITGTPPPDTMQLDRCDFKTIQQTCALFGLDLVSWNGLHSCFRNKMIICVSLFNL